jgi:hypothetical protein
MSSTIEDPVVLAELDTIRERVGHSSINIYPLSASIFAEERSNRLKSDLDRVNEILSATYMNPKAIGPISVSGNSFGDLGQNILDALAEWLSAEEMAAIKSSTGDGKPDAEDILFSRAFQKIELNRNGERAELIFLFSADAHKNAFEALNELGSLLLQCELVPHQFRTHLVGEATDVVHLITPLGLKGASIVPYGD